MSILIKERKNKRFYEMKWEENKTLFERTTDNLLFVVPETPFSILSFLMACQAEQIYPGAAIKNSNAIVYKDNVDYPATFTLKPTPHYERIVASRFLSSQRDNNQKLPKENIPYKYLVAEANLNVLGDINIAPITLDFHFYDVVEIIASFTLPLKNRRFIIGDSCIVEENKGIFFQIGGSNKAELIEEERKEFIWILKRWLSGGFGPRGSRKFFLKNQFVSSTGIKFYGPVTGAEAKKEKLRRLPSFLALLSVHGLHSVMEYEEIAELYLLLKNLKGNVTTKTIQKEDLNEEKSSKEN